MDLAGILLEKRERINELLGVVLIVGALMSTLAILSYDASQPAFFFNSVEPTTGQNWIGRLGATLAEGLLQLFGVTAFLLPVLLVMLGWNRLRQHDRPAYGKVVAHTLLLFSLASLLDLLYGQIVYGGERFAAGGVVGGMIAGALGLSVARTGALIVSATVLAAVIILTTRLSFVRTVQLLARWTRELSSHTYAAIKEMWQAYRDERNSRSVVRRPVARAKTPPTPEVPARQRASIALPTDEAASVTSESRTAPRVISTPMATAPAEKPTPRQRSLPLDKGTRGYVLPPLDLLNEPELQSIESEQELLERAQQITHKLREFAVGGAIVAVHPGPVVTTFEFKPDAGVKYSRITGMSDDLSLALKAESVRIDRMAGRATVGIEVPNRRQETIYPRELIASERFKQSSSKLTLALGKDITGDVFVAELDRMPHLLIAGATGAGKSVGLNGMIVSLLYKATPGELRFIMIDTKMIELGIYADIPHLLIPVVTEAKKAATALKWAVREMEQRYRRLAALGVRNLVQFNDLLGREPDRTMPDPKTGEPVSLSKLPSIVIVIDEMADLMMVSSSEVEESIMRLAQMARAVGIHLILATQRPSVDVITGTIKANFPSRIAFRVSQRVDSRTIIDQQGAEHLLGRGDMLFMATGSSRVVRLHGGYITEAELHRITSYLKKMAKPDFDEAVLRDGPEGAGGTAKAEYDEMYYDAVRTVIQEGKCSITLIQRRLQLGYARAARIVDVMEHEGVVSPGEGSKPREILVGPEVLETIEARPG